MRDRASDALAKRAMAGVARADDELPAAGAERQHLGQTCRWRPVALRQDRHAAAQRLGVAQDMRAEEHRAAAIAQPQDQRPHVAAARADRGPTSARRG